LQSATRIELFLARKAIAFQTQGLLPAATLEAAVSAAGQSLSMVITGTVLIDSKGALMITHRLNGEVDLAAVYRLTGRQMQVLTERQVVRLFDDCDSGFLPPLGAAYDLPMLADSQMDDLPQAIFTSGSNGRLLVLEGRGLRLALAGARKGPLVKELALDVSTNQLTLDQIAARLQKLYRLPPMPALAFRILELTAKPEATAKQLAEVIELDPSMTAQLLRYARSALFGYRGQINSVQDAVARVLGFERVAHVAMGIAAVKSFDVPREGPLGVDQFWRHSLYCAFLSASLARRCGAESGMAYMCGLLHNFGLLLIGHLFPAEYARLSELRDAEPDASMQQLEQEIFGGADQAMMAVGHGTIGGVLHRLWNLPGPVIKAAAMHQCGEYSGEHQLYVNAVILANALLKDIGIGDEFVPDDTVALAAKLGLEQSDLDQARREIADVADDLDAVAAALS
jgi:HD-like signal output (HDOD) protein/prolyl-tRNA editing enzyme YbaK/EbsC (Cys-tRNA(Pro) deacylase)